MNNRIIRIFNYTVILAFTFLAGCKNSDDLDKNGYPKVFKIGLSSTEEDIEEVFRKMEPMRLYLEKELRTPVRYYKVIGYAPAIEALKAKKIHMANMSPFPYLLAREKANVSALMCWGYPDGRPKDNYKTCIITNKKSGLKTLHDIKANISKLTMAFVDPSSTTGHIVPNYYLKQNGIDPEKDFKKVVFSNSAMASILTLYSGKVDVACAELPTILRVSKTNKNVSVNSFNYIWISEALPPSAYCIRNDINPVFRKKVLDAYMQIKKDTAAWGALKRSRKSLKYSSIPLDSLTFVPVDENMYDEFKKIVKTMKDLRIE